MLLAGICILKHGKGMGYVVSGITGYGRNHSRMWLAWILPAWGLGGQTRKNKEFGDIRFFSSHNLLMCGRVHCDSRHSRMLSAVIHVVYIAAVHWEDD